MEKFDACIVHSLESQVVYFIMLLVQLLFILLFIFHNFTFFEILIILICFCFADWPDYFLLLINLFFYKYSVSISLSLIANRIIFNYILLFLKLDYIFVCITFVIQLINYFCYCYILINCIKISKDGSCFQYIQMIIYKENYFHIFYYFFYIQMANILLL